MKRLAIGAAVALLAAGAQAQESAQHPQFYMGAGHWKCSQFVEKIDSGNEVDRAQSIGWVLGFWSSATVYEGKAFVDAVQKAGGKKLFELTVSLCRQHPDALVGTLSKKIVESAAADAEKNAGSSDQSGSDTSQGSN